VQFDNIENGRLPMAYSITEKCTGCTVCKTVCPTGVISGEKKEQHTIEKKYCVNCGACGKICPAGAVVNDRGETCTRIKRSEWKKPVIDLKACAYCACCVSECPADCLEMTPATGENHWGHPQLSDPKKCISCGWCETTCGFDAITMKVINKE